MGTFLAPSGGLWATIFEGFRGSEAHLSRISPNMWGAFNGAVPLGQKNEKKKKRPGWTRKSAEKVTQKRHQKRGRKVNAKNVHVLIFVMNFYENILFNRFAHSAGPWWKHNT